MDIRNPSRAQVVKLASLTAIYFERHGDSVIVQGESETDLLTTLDHLTVEKWCFSTQPST